MPGKTAITNAAIFDGHKLRLAATVLLEDGRITSVTGPAPADIPTDGSIAIVDGTGCTLMPGLIDCHVHVHDEETLRIFPRFGITTVLDMGGPAEASANPLRALGGSTGGGNKGVSPLPSYFSPGLPAVAPGSQHARMVRPPESELVRSPDEAQAFVDRRIAGGADYIKVIADLPGFEPEVLSALTAAARRRGKLSVAHSARQASFPRAVAAGFDVLTHVPMDVALSDETIAAIRAGGQVVCPTLSMVDCMSPVIRMRNPDAPLLGLEGCVDVLRRMHRAGITIVAGTDANGLPMAANPFGESLHVELGLMRRAGMEGEEVLQAATAGAAEVFRLPDRGAVEVGRRADLVLVGADPVADLTRARDDIRRVWIGGEVAFEK